VAGKGGEHVGPDFFVGDFVFGQTIGLDLQKKTDARHGRLLKLNPKMHDEFAV
jgi:hypothetical protein